MRQVKKCPSMLQESLRQENEVPFKVRRGSKKLGTGRVDAAGGTYYCQAVHRPWRGKQGFEPKCSHHS
jgi:hypothetical protein